MTFEQESTLLSIYISRHMIPSHLAVTAGRPLLQLLPDNAPFTRQLRPPMTAAMAAGCHAAAAFSSSWPLTSEALYLSRSRYLDI